MAIDNQMAHVMAGMSSHRLRHRETTACPPCSLAMWLRRETSSHAMNDKRRLRGWLAKFLGAAAFLGGLTLDVISLPSQLSELPDNVEGWERWLAPIFEGHVVSWILMLTGIIVFSWSYLYSCFVSQPDATPDVQAPAAPSPSAGGGRRLSRSEACELLKRSPLLHLRTDQREYYHKVFGFVRETLNPFARPLSDEQRRQMLIDQLLNEFEVGHPAAVVAGEYDEHVFKWWLTDAAKRANTLR